MPVVSGEAPTGSGLVLGVDCAGSPGSRRAQISRASRSSSNRSGWCPHRILDVGGEGIDLVADGRADLEEVVPRHVALPEEDPPFAGREEARTVWQHPDDGRQNYNLIDIL